MTDSMVERVARAIYETLDQAEECAVGQYHSAPRKTYLSGSFDIPAAARAAIAAMLEPVAAPADTPKDYMDPDWDAAGRVHDWRNHVREEVREIWHTFTPEQRAVLAADADYMAGNEEWD